jgi:hypothetical protein
LYTGTVAEKGKIILYLLGKKGLKCGQEAEKSTRELEEYEDI